MRSSFIKNFTHVGSYSTPGLGLENPAFSIQLLDFTDELQQKNNGNELEDYDNETYDLKVNDEIIFKYKNKTKKGIIRKILKNAYGDVYKITVDTYEDNENIDINPTMIIKIAKSNTNNDTDRIVSAQGISESNELLHIQSFENFIKNKYL